MLFFIYFCATLIENKSIAFHTLGCKLNFSETSTITRLFDEEGYDNLIYQHLTENYYPDHGWGSEMYRFYTNEIKKYGIFDFLINGESAYSYLGEWDGYDHLYTLSIRKWVSDELTSLFGHKWIPVFKTWFENNSDLEVRDMDLYNKYLYY